PEHIRTAVKGDLSLGVAGTYSRGINCSLQSPRITLATAAIGPVPVALVGWGTVDCDAKVKASIDMERSWGVHVGAEYIHGRGFQTIRERTGGETTGPGVSWHAEDILDWADGGGVALGAKLSAAAHPTIAVGNSVMGAGGG